MTDKIFFFIREAPYGFLSNFERTPFIVDGVEYPNNETFYQAQKAKTIEVHDYILIAPHARIAMVLGRQLEHNEYLEPFMKSNWSFVKLRHMLKGLRCKFENPELKKMLLDTGDAELHENNEDDPFWGVGSGDGYSWLGNLLMVVREEKRRGWECSDFGYVRCDEITNAQCPFPLCHICVAVAEYDSTYGI